MSNTIDRELGDLNNSFPIGIFLPSGKRLTRFVVREFNGHLEKKLGQLEDQFQGEEDFYLRLYLIHLEFLPLILQNIEGFPLESLAKECGHSTVDELLGNLYLVDVLIILLTLRSRYYGSELPLSSICPCPAQKKLQEGLSIDHLPHDLNSLVIKVWQLSTPPEYVYQATIGPIRLTPFRFRHLPTLEVNESIPLHLNYLRNLSEGFGEENYRQLRTKEKLELKNLLGSMLDIGPERKIAMDCPCGMEWDSPLLNGINYEKFYGGLFSPPRQRKLTVEETIDEIAFFLMTGEQAPCASIKDVFDLTPTRRVRWVEKLSDVYQKQAEEMDKAKRKRK